MQVQQQNDQQESLALDQEQQSQIIVEVEEQQTVRNITVHLVGHSHVELGRVKTLEQYFSGTEHQLSSANVELILDSVVDQLTRRNQTKFAFAEMKYFSMWYNK